MLGTAGDTLLVCRALDLAAQRHAGQMRKGLSGQPFINHLTDVALMLAEAGAPPELVAAGLLHDVLEKSSLTSAELTTSFGTQIRDWVLELTDDPTLSEKQRKREQVLRAPGLSDGAKMIKIADKTSRLRTIPLNPPGPGRLAAERTRIGWAIDVVRGCRGVNDYLDSRFDEAVHAAEQLLKGA